jgi:hypothetical protein
VRTRGVRTSASRGRRGYAFKSQAVFVNALRETLGLEPLYALESQTKLTDEQRFAHRTRILVDHAYAPYGRGSTKPFFETVG